MDGITTVSASTRPASRLPEVSSEELARMAHGVLQNLDFLEMNDGNRIGYHLSLSLRGEVPSIVAARPRTSIPSKKLVRIIAERLGAAGVATA